MLDQDVLLNSHEAGVGGLESEILMVLFHS